MIRLDRLIVDLSETSQDLSFKYDGKLLAWFDDAGDLLFMNNLSRLSREELDAFYAWLVELMEENA